MLPPASEAAPPLLEVCLFGWFKARVGGTPLPRLRSRKGQWLLALLALNAERDVERSWLAGTLWPDTSESHALASLRQSLNDLRHALGPAASLLVAPAPRTLRLDAAGAHVDVLAFDVAVRAGDIRSLERAVSLYAGPLLEGCCDEPWALEERQAREQAYLAALEALAATASAQKEHAGAIRHLRRAVAADPFRESAHRALMQVLAAAGNVAAALLVFRDLRLFLRREIGADPDEETRRIYEQLRADARERAGVRKTPVPTAASPAPRALDSLPRPLTRLIGREDEVGGILGALAEARLVTLTGTGGVGKTRLAIHLAEEVQDDFADGVFFVDLAPLGDPALAPHAVAGALGISENPGSPIVETVRQYLRPRSLLLLLDNCEHLLDACAQMADRLLSACPGLRILATSRQPLGLTGEVVRRVPSLDAPPGDHEPLETLRGYPAVRLFEERARAVLSSFAITEQNGPFVAQICRRLDGIPLAIELAAARARALSPEQIARRLDDRFGLLTGGSRGALPRQQTLRATLEWSYALLSPLEQALLRRLSVFAGGWTLEAAEAVCSGEGIGCGDVVELLTALVDRSLVVVEEVGDTVRYRLLETLRQYARERLLESGKKNNWRGRHRDYFLDLSEEARRFFGGGEQGAWLGRLEREHGNLRAALEWCLEDTDGAGAGLRLAASLWPFWEVRGHFREGRMWYAAVLSQEANQEPTIVRSDALYGAGVFASYQANFAAAEAFFAESLALRREFGDPARVAGALHYLANVAREQARYDTARCLYEEALGISRAGGDRTMEALNLNDLGIVALCRGDFVTARNLFADALGIRRGLADRWLTSHSLGDLGITNLYLGEYEAAQALLDESLVIRQEMGDRWGIALVLNNLGALAYYRGDLDRAWDLSSEGLTIRRELGDERACAESLYVLTKIAVKQHDFRVARVLLTEGLAIYHRIGKKEGVIHLLDWSAVLAATCARFGRAARLYGATEALRKTVGVPPQSADQDVFHQALAQTRTVLDASVFTAEWAKGSALTWHEAVEYALEDPC